MNSSFEFSKPPLLFVFHFFSAAEPTSEGPNYHSES